MVTLRQPGHVTIRLLVLTLQMQVKIIAYTRYPSR